MRAVVRPLQVLDAVVEVCRVTFGTTLQWIHEFAVENVAWKREFIRQHAQLRLILSDLVVLSNNSWTGFVDVGSEIGVGTLETLSGPVDLLTAGFECDTVSHLNRFLDVGGRASEGAGPWCVNSRFSVAPPRAVAYARP